MKKASLAVASVIFTIIVSHASGQPKPASLANHKPATSTKKNKQASTSSKTNGVRRANPVNLIPLSPQEKQDLQDEFQKSNSALSEYAAGNYAAAEADANDAIADGGHSEENGLLGRILLAEGKNAEALDALSLECEDQTSLEEPRNGLPYALALLEVGQTEKAITVYNAVLPNIAYGHLLQKYSHFDPEHPPVQLTTLKAFIHIGMGLTNFDERIGNSPAQMNLILSEYTKALALQPASPLANLYYAYGLSAVGKTTEMKAALSKTANMSSGDIKDAALNPEF